MRIEDYPDNFPGQMTIYDYDECLTDDMKWEKAITHFNEVQKRYACLGFSYSANTRPFKDFYDKLDEIIEFANGRHVELKPSCVPCFPNNDSEPEVTLYFSTLFMDNRRRMK